MTDNEWDQIIAIRFGGLVCFGQDAVDKLKSFDDYDQIFSRAEFRLLARFDLGEKWAQYAEAAPIIFDIIEPLTSEERNPRPFKRGCAHRIPNCACWN